MVKISKARDNATQGGLVLLTPGSATNGTVGSTGGITFSAASTVSVDNIFSSTYDNYKIVLSYTTAGSSGAALTMRLRTSSGDISTLNHFYGLMRYGFNGTQYNAGASTAQTSWLITHSYTLTNSLSLDIFNPFVSTRQTNLTGNMYGVDSGSNAETNGVVSARFDNNTSFTGFSLIQATTTMTGTLQVYGYKK